MIFHASSISAQQLYIGTNYLAHDVGPDQWRRDAALMKECGYNCIRVNHIAWDSIEPTDGHFDMEWFDDFMDLMADSGIGVLLDIPLRSAPLWLHAKCPSVNIVDAEGHMNYPNHRYMEDVGDPDYQRYALRMADTLTRRYAKHPALLAFGIDNEAGDGPISYSETVRRRFIDWLKSKYGTTEALNVAWAGQRWSRRVSDFEEVGLPLPGAKNGAPERVLDFRRFLSDEINGFYFKVLDIVEKNAPGTLTNTNAWYYSRKYYDYAPMAYSGRMTREGAGFYPGGSLTDESGLKRSLFGNVRIQFEATTPFWCSEFLSSTATPGAVRQAAYLTLMYGNQMVCSWLWQIMWGSEEQFLQGLVDWDGVPNAKYDEYRQLAAEFKRIEAHFPYLPTPDTAIALSFASNIAGGYSDMNHESQAKAAFNVLYDKNRDVRIVDPAYSELPYKLLIIPGMTVMEERAADNIRLFVEKGGTVVMSGNSAVLDETGKAFATTHPGRLSDVFGLRVGGYGETRFDNELSRTGDHGNALQVHSAWGDFRMESQYFDRLYPAGAETLGSIVNFAQDLPVITSHRYGKGMAIYVGLPADEAWLSPLLDRLTEELSLHQHPEVPQEVRVRQIDANHILYLNVGDNPAVIPLKGRTRSLLSDKIYRNGFTLAPHEPEFIEIP